MGEHEGLQPLVELEQQNIALLFANYLATLGIVAKVVSETKQAHMVYCEHDKIAQAKAEFDIFIKTPFEQKYQQAAWQHGETVTLNSSEITLLANFKENFFDHAGIVTLLVFALCWLVFIGSNIGWGQSIFSHLQFYPRFSIDAFLSEPWRL